MKSRLHSRLCLLLLAMLPLTGCLFRSHKIKEPALSTAPLQTANAADLVAHLNDISHAIQTLNATVDFATSVGGVKRGKVTEYKEIRGYILVRQPDMLRMIGLAPVVRTKAFDMVSDGTDFKLYIPATNKFYVGKNSSVAPGARGLTALRPQIIYDALMLKDIDSQSEISVLESGSETVEDVKTHHRVQQADYRLDVIRRGSKGWFLAQRFYFNRENLRPRRQTVYDENGDITSNVHYGIWKEYGSIWFPSVIQINRPEEEYEITIGIVELKFNGTLTNQQFAMTQPPGAQLVRINGGMSAEKDAPPAAAQQQPEQPH